MSQQAEPSIHEYARFHDLVQDHKANDPFHYILPPNAQTYRTTLEDPQNGGRHKADECPKTGSGERHVEVDDCECTGCCSGATNMLPMEMLNERMFIDAKTASLLASILQSGRVLSPSLQDLGVDTKRYQRLKHELPLLCTDPACDLQEFSQSYTPDLKNEFLPLETLDEAADEGLTWPSSYRNLPDERWKKILVEKPEISAEALRYLFETTKCNSQDGSVGSLDLLQEEGCTYERKNLPRPSTPPLLPMSPESIPFVPSSAVGELQLLSDQPSPTIQELRKAELQIFTKDAVKLLAKAPGLSPQSSDPMLFDSDSLGDVYSPMKGMRDSPSSPPDERLHPQHLKVEVPLSAMKIDGEVPCQQKSVPFNEALTRVISHPKEPLLESERVQSPNTIDPSFNEAIESILSSVEQSIEQEQLQKADTTCRVTVPTMDFTLPTVPWKVALARPEFKDTDGRDNRFLLELKTTYLKDQIWPLAGKLEQGLRWTPFPTILGKTDLQEAILADDSHTMLWAQPSCSATHTQTWKPEGLRILDEVKALNGDELDEGSFHEAQGLDCLVRKRKLNLQAGDEVAPSLKPSIAETTKRGSSSRGGTAPFLASLEYFISTRTGVHRARSESKVDAEVVEAAVPAQVMESDLRNISNHANQPWRSCPSTVPSTIGMAQDPRVFIFSSTLFKDRKLARQIQHRYPKAELIERDFSPYSYLEKDLPQPSFALSEETLNTLGYDADIMLSPSTGLLWTTLQKISQRPLPGQTTQSAIRERIRWTAPKYERLIVIVDVGSRLCESGRSHVVDKIDSSVFEAVTHFGAFCASLEDATLMILSYGGVEELSNLIVDLMIKHSVPYPACGFVQDETAWELFLRAAGMNAFAAQVVLSELDRKNIDSRMSSDFGLTAFIKMSQRERLARFERLLGGGKLLSRVEDIFQACW